MAVEILKALQIHKARDGSHSDGGGLYLVVRTDQAAKRQSASWVFRFTSPGGKQRYMGLGVADRSSISVAAESLARARKAVREARELQRRGIDPIDQRDSQKVKARVDALAKKSSDLASETTLARFARAYHDRVIEPNRTTKHGAQWISSLEQHVTSSIWHKPIADVTAPELLDMIADLQTEIPETASRIRQRLEVVFDDAEFRGARTGNPARAIRRKLREVKPRRSRGSFAALDYHKAPALIQQLRVQEGIAASALEFAVLMAARTSEVLGATWSEIDARSAIWTVPAARMKGGEQHVVYLTPRALEILAAMRPLQQSYVFPSTRLNGKPLSNMAMLQLLKRLNVNDETTVHGLCRSTFSTWANELGIARPDVIEACLAHQEGNLVRAAYNRAQFARERAALLSAWADYLDGKEPASNVIEFAQPKVA